MRLPQFRRDFQNATLRKLPAHRYVNWQPVVRLVKVKLKLNKFHFCKQYCHAFNMDTNVQEKYNIKSPSLSGSRIVGEAFVKSLSILSALTGLQWTMDNRFIVQLE